MEKDVTVRKDHNTVAKSGTKYARTYAAQIASLWLNLLVHLQRGIKLVSCPGHHRTR